MAEWKGKPNENFRKEGTKYKPGMYISGSKDHKMFNLFMQVRKAFYFTSTEEAQADLVQCYAELAEKEKKGKKRRKE